MYQSKSELAAIRRPPKRGAATRTTRIYVGPPECTVRRNYRAPSVIDRRQLHAREDQVTYRELLDERHARRTARAVSLMFWLGLLQIAMFIVIMILMR